MNLEFLKTYCEVVKLGGLCKAARKLYLSQVAVSFQIKSLERELGCRLIERDRNNFSITFESKRFFRFAEYVFLEHQHVLSELTKMRQGVRGNLIIASSPIIGEFLLLHALSEFWIQNPHINIELVLAGSFKAIEAVEKGTKTVGFCSILPTQPALEYQKIGKDEQVLILYPGHPFWALKEIAVSDLMGETLILHAEPVGIKHSYNVPDYSTPGIRQIPSKDSGS